MCIRPIIEKRCSLYTHSSAIVQIKIVQSHYWGKWEVFLILILVLFKIVTQIQALSHYHLTSPFNHREGFPLTNTVKAFRDGAKITIPKFVYYKTKTKSFVFFFCWVESHLLSDHFIRTR